MRDWILMIIAVNPSLERMSQIIDQKVEDLALSPIGDTLNKVETIIRLNEKKILLINLRVVNEKIRKKLDGEEYALIKEFAFGKTVRAVSENIGASSSTTYRKLNKAFKKAENVLISLGYDKEKMEGYLNFPYIKAKVLAIKKRNKKANLFSSAL